MGEIEMTRDESRFDPDDALREIDSPKPDDGQFQTELPADLSAADATDETLPGTGPELVAGLGSQRAQDVPSPSPPTPPSPAPSAQPDGSNEQAAPGEADPPTESAPPLGGNTAGPADHGSFGTIHGPGDFQHPSGGLGAVPTLPPFLQRALEREAGSPFGPGSPSSAASPGFVVEVRVDFTPAGLAHAAEESTRFAAKFSRKEIGMVSQRLDELNEEIRIREANHRTVWDR
jgi:hypothetical protein